MDETIWLTWEVQRRNRSASAALGARLFELNDPQQGIRRYARSVLRTFSILRRTRPRIVFAQNPSLILAALVTTYGRLTRTPVVIDAHNAGVFPFDGRKRWANLLARTVMRHASLTLVSNDRLAAYVERQGGSPFVLPDPLPELHAGRNEIEMNGAFNVLFVCTWADDEPYGEVLQAAAQLPDDVRILVTGASKGRERRFGPLPANVTLTGFVDEEQFVGLLCEADLVMDLTTREDCLVCGAYEAVAAGTPMLLSDTRALRSYFHRGALYTDNTRDDIANKIVQAQGQRDELRAGVRALERELRSHWAQRHHALIARLRELGTEASLPEQAHDLAVAPRRTSARLRPHPVRRS
jgi:glycosyltransferase involved in cell wall biosynthesis